MENMLMDVFPTIKFLETRLKKCALLMHFLFFTQFTNIKKTKKQLRKFFTFSKFII